MSTQNNLTDFLTAVADSIRAKKETSALINPQDFPTEIASIPSGSSLGYNVTFVANGNDYYLASVPVGGTVEEPADPSAEGYSLVGWFTQENGGGSEVFFPYTPTADITLYAYIVSETFITFSSDEPFDFGVSDKTKRCNGTMEYSTNKIDWATWDCTTFISAVKHGGKYYIALRGTGNTYITGSQASYSPTGGSFSFVGGLISCSGNIETLLDYTTVQNGQHPTMGNHCFYNLFRKCSITSAPKLLSPVLSNSCYQSMFSGCGALTTAPVLSATSLTESCYSAMFSGCTSLMNAPALPATILQKNCYKSMFQDCSSLTTAPDLPSTSLAESCYELMFSGCSLLVTAPSLPATTCPKHGYYQMFSNCISLIIPPALPATTLSVECYWHMFSGCKQLSYIPQLPALVLQNYCYGYMFQGCTKIRLSTVQTGDYQIEYRIPTSGTGTIGGSSLSSMFTNTGGTFTGTPTINTTYYTSNTVIPQPQTLVGGETYENLSGEYDFTLNEWENITVNFTTAYGQNVYVKVTANALDSEDEFLVDKFINGSYSSGSYVNNIPPDSPYTTSSGISSSQSLSYKLISEMTTASGKIILSPSPIT